jgi:hypothetical protein
MKRTESTCNIGTDDFILIITVDRNCSLSPMSPTSTSTCPMPVSQKFTAITLAIYLWVLNCWVMHPVARVSTNTLIKTTVRNKCFSC